MLTNDSDDNENAVMATTHRSHKRSKELPKNAKLVKRHIPRPIPPPRLSADPKVVYVSSKSPFISTVKRVRKALNVFKDQSKIGVSSRQQRRVFQRKQTDPIDDKKKYVTIQATGRAIEKALALGLYFQGQKDTTIEIRTSTVECKDDVVPDNTNVTFEGLMKAKEKTDAKRQATAQGKDAGNAMDIDVDIPEEVDEDEFEEVDDEFPSRTRNTSVIEVIVRNKPPG
ncbi:hypothetical protein ABW19_dt0209167 [Dactylella cylindrospora]|nr:hypothetical protein ABW19_dt0209167 [Dactylella cylindrospora]